MRVADKKFLDYDGIKKYHDELIKNLKDLNYDPQRMFESKEDLLNKSNWTDDKYGRIFGLKKGLIVTVNNVIWQLANPELFQTKMNTIGVDLNTLGANELGWNIISGSDTEKQEPCLPWESQKKPENT